MIARTDSIPSVKPLTVAIFSFPPFFTVRYYSGARIQESGVRIKSLAQILGKNANIICLLGDVSSFRIPKCLKCLKAYLQAF